LEAEKKVFVRKATGLVREIGPLTAIVIVLTNVIGLGWQKRLFQWSATGTPETQFFLGLPPIVMSFLIVGVIVLLTVWVFAILGAAMPRSGGGYVYISRLVHPFVGFIASWAEYFSIAVSYGMIGSAVFEAILIYAGIARWAVPSWVGDPWFLCLGGIVIVVIFGLLALMGVRMYALLLQVIFVIPLVITVFVYISMLAATPQAMAAGIQEVAGVAPEAFTQKAISLGMPSTATPYWDAVSAAAIGSYWAYIGFAASTFVAGEVKEATKNLPRTLFAANLFIIFLYVTISIICTRAATMVGKVGDYSFFSAYAWMSYGPKGNVLSQVSATMPKAWMPNIAAFSAYGLGWSWIVALIPLFAVFWVANDIPPFILTSSRILFAMAFDRVMPERLADVSERWHSPVTAIFVTMLVAFLGSVSESNIIAGWPVLGAYFNADACVAWTDIWDTLFFLLSCVAAVFFVMTLRGRNIYEKSAYKPSKTVIGTVGLIATLGNIYLLYLVANGYRVAEPWIATLILLVSAALVYYYYKGKGSRVGVDYTTIYAEIPPE